MRIQNTTLADICLNYRTGQTVVVPAGQYVIRPAGDLDYLDDTAVTLALFSGGSLVLYNDDGSAYTGSALPSAPKAPAAPQPVMATPSPSGQKLQGTGVAYSNSRRLVLDGDSITAQGNPVNAGSIRSSNHGWWCHAMALLDTNLKVVGNAAVSGQGAGAMLARFDQYVAPLQPDEIWGIIGQNNLGDADNGAQCLADIRAYAIKARAIGATLRLGTVTPRSSASMTASSTLKINILRINTGLRAMRDEGLILLFDANAALIDPISVVGAARAGVQYDNDIHPNALGAYYIGKEFADTFPDLKGYAPGPMGALDSRLMNAASARLPMNPKCAPQSGGTAGTATTGTVAGNWLLGRQQGSALTIVGAVEADPVRPGRSWQKMTFSGTVASSYEYSRFQQSIALASLLAPVVPGITQITRARARLKAANVSSNIRAVRLYIEQLDATPATIFSQIGMSDSTYTQTILPSGEWVIDCPVPAVILANCTTIRVSINVMFDVGTCAGDIWVTDIDIETDAA